MIIDIILYLEMGILKERVFLDFTIKTFIGYLLCIYWETDLPILLGGKAVL